MINSLPDLQKVSLEKWHEKTFEQNEIEVDILRLDKIHPVISGNKWFKLKYYLNEASRLKKKKLITYGGAYSNHLVAVAAAANLFGYNSAGMVRGEEPVVLSPTLLEARTLGMDLKFLSRSEYDLKKTWRLPELTEQDDIETITIPEGGAGILGARGAGDILSLIPTNMYTHIACAVGTGTTLAGIIDSANEQTVKIGVSVLKGTKNFEPLNPQWIKNKDAFRNVLMIHEDHFDGYAKRNKTLLNFMNLIYAHSGIPTDFVYTGKLFYSIHRLSENGFFTKGNRVLIIHSGGLQGNRSIPPGVLQF